MTTRSYVALLRGINVGGRNKIAMQDLRDLAEGLGHTGVVTYIQSGNLVFSSDVGSEATLVAGLEGAISERLGLTIPVVLRSHDELIAALAANPYAEQAEIDGAKVFISFLTKVPPATAVAKLDPDRSPPDVFTVTGREIYLWCPGGIGNSKLTSAFFKPVGEEATARNIKTVKKLIELSRS